MAFTLISTEYAYRGKPVNKGMNAVNYTLQSVFEAQNLDPRESVILEELCRRDDQPGGVIAGGWRRPNVHGPIATRVPQFTPDLVLQKFWDIGYISIHREVGQTTRIPLQLLQ